MSLLRGHPPVLLGEGVELLSVPVPPALAGKRLRDSGIGSRTGLSVVALKQGSELVAPLTSDTPLPAGAELVMLGSDEQRAAFAKAFGNAERRRE
jgi:K+/H+ antiporter YhaU regulatory subunit KhtT